MNAQLTIEQKARVFAQHIGCALSVPNKPREHWYPFDQNEGGLRLEGVIGGRMFVRRIAETVTDKYKQCYLLLRPLSAITDEDAIGLAKLYEPNSIEHEVSRLSAVCVDYTISASLPTHEDTLFIEDDWSGLSILAVQYLIQRGYAVPLFIAPGHPLNGKTAIEMGMAIDITSLNNDNA